MVRVAFVACVAALGASAAIAQSSGEGASGRGQLPTFVDGTKRQFSFSAQGREGGAATGNAVIRNSAFDGDDGRDYYALVDVKCLKIVGNIAIVGGVTRRTNDAILDEAVFFTAQDNGEPGAGRDKLSRAFFWDELPGKTGDPMACLNTGPNDFPLETIESGNITVRGNGSSSALEFRTL